MLKVFASRSHPNTGGATAKSYAAAVQALTLMALVPCMGGFGDPNWVGRCATRGLFFLICVELFYLGRGAAVP